jgi:hypothetical protein
MPSDRSPAPIADDTIIRRGDSFLTAGVGDETVMMDSKTGRYLGLDVIGSDIWRRLETPRSFSDLVDALTSDYEADRAVIADDVRKLLAEMAEADLVKLS